MILSYFKKGFNLTNKSLILVIINALFFILFTAETYFADELIRLLLLLPVIVLVLLNISFSFLTPLFLKKRDEGEKFNIREILIKSFVAIKRLIGPTLFFIGGFIVIIIFSVLIWSILPINLKEPFSSSYGFLGQIQIAQVNIPLTILFNLIFSSLVFVPILFSLKNNGVWVAIRNSIYISLKNPLFFGVVFVFELPTLYSANLANQNLFSQLIRQMIVSYFNVWIAAASLYYYQNKIVKTNET